MFNPNFGAPRETDSILSRGKILCKSLLADASSEEIFSIAKLGLKIFFGIFILSFSLSGCSHVSEISKTFWGSSTRALDKARAEALSKDFSCTFSECFETVLNISKEQEYTIFIEDRLNQRIVIIGIKGNVDTTEVGIFFESIDEKMTKIEIASLSGSAKRKIAASLFPSLYKTFRVREALEKEASQTSGQQPL